MGIADDLQKLEQLRQSGALNDDEFRLAKEKLLEPAGTTGKEELGELLGDQLVELRHQNELAQLDREWEIERRQYYVIGQYGRSFIPTAGTAIATVLVGGLFGAFWTFMALTVRNAQGQLGFGNESFSTIESILPWIGVLFIVISVIRGIYLFLLAQNHAVAYQAYREKRLRASERTSS